MGPLISHATYTVLARNERGHSVKQAWILQGINEGFAWNFICFLVLESEGYKDHADLYCTTMYI